MAGRDRPNVALSSKQRNHRRLPHEDGSLTASGLRFSKLQKLPIEGCCNVFLRKLGSGSAPIFGVEPPIFGVEPASSSPTTLRRLRLPVGLVAGTGLEPVRFSRTSGF